MASYISIIRGINVSGQKLIKMTDLRQLYENLGFEKVTTYLQSGNVLFSSTEKDTRVLEELIASVIKNSFGFDVPVIVLKAETLEVIIRDNPFVHDEDKDVSFLYVTFLSASPLKSPDLEKILTKRKPREEIAFVSNVVYLYCPNGYGTTKLNNNFLETKLKVKATTRNWKTTTELLKLAHSVSSHE